MPYQPGQQVAFYPNQPRQRGVERAPAPQAVEVPTFGIRQNTAPPDGLLYWLKDWRPIQEPLRSVQLDKRDMWPQKLVNFTGGLRQTAARGTPSIVQDQRGPWALRYHALVHQTYVAVPLWAAVGPPRFNAGQNRAAFRRPQPGVKTQALARALGQSAAAIAQARGR